MHNEKKYDKEELVHMYWEEGMSTLEIADEFGVSSSAIQDAMVRRGISRRNKDNGRVTYSVVNGGYCVARYADSMVRIHNLLMVSMGEDPYTVFDSDMHTHHTNGIPWDNRPENLELLSASEHTSLHANNRDYEGWYDHSSDPWWDEDLLRELYWDEGMTMEEIGDELGVSQSTINDRFDDFEIESRGAGRTKPKPWRDKETLTELYWEDDNTQREIADTLGCSVQTIRNWMHTHDIVTR